SALERGRFDRDRRGERGQSTVELAVVLPVVVLLLLATVQAAMLVRDRILLVNAARAVGRAVIVSPSVESAREALQTQDPAVAAATVAIGGQSSSGGLATVTLKMPATKVPVVGRLVAGIVLEEKLTVRVEGPD
ncbi:MAG TPA: TadE/TadG family type IV pilus assembly protein, partial [Microthrixaceae bacterium]|nr:TadE/TadG family type IV pilus assembly protein [Microthrixaceae bacterium]